ncbi:MAG: cytidine deaminase [Candidatus Obscuribacterales bacterium]|nr:cytidine deaminase [Candidatus Obscuribacterales bacterium]
MSASTVAPTRIVTATSRTPKIVLPELIEVHADDSKRYQELIEIAKAQSKTAYCPYSNFNVGAALLAFDGQIYKGCNVEAASYSRTGHAEETAVNSAIADGLLDRAKAAGLSQFEAILAVAVYAEKGNDPWPCCHCRDRLCEFGYNMHIIGADQVGKTDKILCLTLGQLIPHPFPIEEVLAAVRGDKK